MDLIAETLELNFKLPASPMPLPAKDGSDGGVALKDLTKGVTASHAECVPFLPDWDQLPEWTQFLV